MTFIYSEAVSSWSGCAGFSWPPALVAWGACRNQWCFSRSPKRRKPALSRLSFYAVQLYQATIKRSGQEFRFLLGCMLFARTCFTMILVAVDSRLPWGGVDFCVGATDRIIRALISICAPVCGCVGDFTE